MTDSILPSYVADISNCQFWYHLYLGNTNSGILNDAQNIGGDRWITMERHSYNIVKRNPQKKILDY